MKILGTIIVTTILFTGLICGCSGKHGSPVTPGSNPEGEPGQVGAAGPTSQRIPLGAYRLRLDFDNLTVETTLDRLALSHIDATYLVQPPVCDDCIKITIEGVDTERRVINLRGLLKNPFTQITAYDPRLILDPEVEGYKITNHWSGRPDGYTTLWDQWGEPLNPFVAYAKDQENRQVAPGSEHEQMLDLYYPEPPEGFSKADLLIMVDASYPANCEEAYKVVVDMQEWPDEGESVPIQVVVHDHQGIDTIVSVNVTAPDLFDGDLELNHVYDLDPDGFIFLGSLQNDLGGAEGISPVSIQVIDNVPDPDLGQIDAWQIISKANPQLGNIFTLGEVVDTAIAQDGSATELEYQGQTVEILADSIVDGTEVLLYQADARQDVAETIIGEAFAVKIQDLDEPDQNLHIYMHIPGVPIDAEQGEYDLIGAISDASGEEHYLYSWAIPDSGSITKAVSYNPNAIYSVVDQNAFLGINRSATSEGPGIPRLTNRKLGDIGADPPAKEVNFVFVHGTDFWDGIFGPQNTTLHWSQIAPQDTEILSQPLLSDLSGEDKAQTMFYWYYYNTDQSTYNNGVWLAEAINSQILSSNPDAEIVLVGFSMGGLVSLWAYYGLVNYYDKPEDVIDALITLDSPMIGIEAVNILMDGRSQIQIYWHYSDGVKSMRSIYDVEYLGELTFEPWPEIIHRTDNRNISLNSLRSTSFIQDHLNDSCLYTDCNNCGTGVNWFYPIGGYINDGYVGLNLLYTPMTFVSTMIGNYDTNGDGNFNIDVSDTLLRRLRSGDNDWGYVINDGLVPYYSQLGYTIQQWDDDSWSWNHGFVHSGPYVNAYDPVPPQTGRVDLDFTIMKRLKKIVKKLVEHLVPPPNQPPTAGANSTNTNIYTGQGVTFYDDSSDPDGFSDIQQFEWDFSYIASEGFHIESSDEDPPTHYYNTSGTYYVQHRVEDSVGNEDFLDVLIQVNVSDEPVNQPPIAGAIADYYTIDVGDWVNFTDTSSDPDGYSDITIFQWDFSYNSGDGFSVESSAQNPSKQFNIAGTFYVHHRVYDSVGHEDYIDNYLTINVQSGYDCNENYLLDDDSPYKMFIYNEWTDEPDYCNGSLGACTSSSGVLGPSYSPVSPYKTYYYATFEKGCIIHIPDDSATIPVSDPIFSVWNYGNAGYNEHNIGLPLDEATIYASRRIQECENWGCISALGEIAYVVQGSIYDHWMDYHNITGGFGCPTSGEYTEDGIDKQNFEYSKSICHDSQFPTYTFECTSGNEAGFPLDNYMEFWDNFYIWHWADWADGKTVMGDNLICAVGQPVYAMSAGKVKYAGNTGWGQYGYAVIIEHYLSGYPNYDGRICTLYGHLGNSLQVSVGSIVHKGDVVGYIGNTTDNGGWPETQLWFAVFKDSYYGNWYNYPGYDPPGDIFDTLNPVVFVNNY